MENTSKRFQINWLDVWKSVRTMLVVAAAAVVLYFINNIQPDLVAKLPESYAVWLPVITFLTELVRRWATNYNR